jgi:hypothetical protein
VFRLHGRACRNGCGFTFSAAVTDNSLVRPRDRTVDFPIFRTQGNSSPNNAHVRNLHFCIDSNADELGRTQTDETKDETTTHPGTRGRNARPSRRWRRRPSVVIDDASPLPVGCPGCGLVRRSGSKDVSRRPWPDVAMDVVESAWPRTDERFGGGGVLGQQVGVGGAADLTRVPSVGGYGSPLRVCCAA